MERVNSGQLITVLILLGAIVGVGTMFGPLGGGSWQVTTQDAFRAGNWTGLVPAVSGSLVGGGAVIRPGPEAVSWPRFKRSPGNTGVNRDATGAMTRTTVRKESVPLPSSMVAAPAVADMDRDGLNEILVPTTTGLLLVENKSVTWTFSTDAAQITTAPVVTEIDGDGWPDIVVGDNAGRVAVVNRYGEHLYNHRIPGRVQGVNAADIDDDGRQEVVAASSDGAVYAFNPSDQEWRYRSGALLYFQVPAIDPDGTVYAPDSAGRLHAIRDGQVLWRAQLPGPIKSSPTVADVDRDGSTDIVVGGPASIHLIRRNGTVAWTVETGEAMEASPTVADIRGDGRKEIVARGVNPYGTGHLFLFSANGEEVWRKQLNSQADTAPVVADVDTDADQEILVADSIGTLYVMDADGGVEWTTELGGPPAGHSVVADVDNRDGLEIVAGAVQRLTVVDGALNAAEYVSRVKQVSDGFFWREAEITATVPGPAATLITVTAFNRTGPVGRADFSLENGTRRYNLSMLPATDRIRFRIRVAGTVSGFAVEEVVIRRGSVLDLIDQWLTT